ncbi:hypothetical protein M9978_21080 [Sphingomonas sp. MG17]|uniref:Uncharacterized protein n=1 Tax=Sphingomonas tagetis TaxID=2949092 RepID=A0A9X2HP74_9SPHN|nr:hypothetical protein [Sphingomonas tagetis]MCP3732914.1 hypothetical protein [Sphingomonas tagetis]
MTIGVTIACKPGELLRSPFALAIGHVAEQYGGRGIAARSAVADRGPKPSGLV